MKNQLILQTPGDTAYNSKYHSNPFISDLNITFYRYLQITFMSVTLVPLKIICITISIFFAWLIAAVATFGLDSEQSKPIGKFRKILFVILQMICRLTAFFMGVYWLQIRGKRATSKEAPIMVASPHSSIFDIILFVANTPVPSAVARKEGSEVPFLRCLYLAAQTISVSRENNSSRRNAINIIKKRVNNCHLWPQLLIFSEGTTGNRKEITKFRNGAFIPAVPVQPVTIEYLNDWDTFTWTCDNDDQLLKLMWLSLCQFQIKIRITYMDVYVPKDDELTKPDVYASNVQLTVANFLNLPLSDLSFEDNKLMEHAKLHHLPLLTGAIGFFDLKAKYNLSFTAAKELLELFSKISETTGLVTKEKFLKFFKFPDCNLTRKLFEKYNVCSDDAIDFKRFVLGRLTYFNLGSDADLLQLFRRIVGGGNEDEPLLQLDELVRMQDNYLEFSKESIHQLFYSLTNRPLMVVKFEEFCFVVRKWPEYAKMLEQLTTIENTAS